MQEKSLEYPGDDLGVPRIGDVDERQVNEPGLHNFQGAKQGKGRRDSPTKGYGEEAADGGQLWPRFGAYLEDELPERRGKGVGR